MTHFHTIRDLDLKGKIVLLRADLNVPAQGGKVTDTTRIDRLKPTIDYLCNAGARILILSHFGRPEGQRNPAMSLEFLPPILKQCWGHPVRFATDCIGGPAQNMAAEIKDGDIALLENVRFHKEETANDPEFCKQLAALGDVYINDAFSASHRAHASTEGLAHLLPCAAGLLMEEELNALNKALETPQKPVVAIAGGSKISTKLGVLYNLIDRVDYLVLGGGMANTFLHATGAEMGASLCEKDMAGEARKIIEHAQKKGCEIVLPADSIIVEDLHENADFKIAPSMNIPDGYSAIDVGPESLKELENILKNCKTLLWNGPLGVFEIKPFDKGTNALAEITATLTQQGKLISVAGGGDTVAALENSGQIPKLSYVSTAGGAFLEWLQGKTLPGVAALSNDRRAA